MSKFQMKPLQGFLTLKHPCGKRNPWYLNVCNRFFSIASPCAYFGGNQRQRQNGRNKSKIHVLDISRHYVSAVDYRRLPKESQVVISGGGIIGCSIAYHLTKLGWKDVTVIEQGKLTCGTTWHAAGLVGQLKLNSTENKLYQYSAQLYKQFDADEKYTGWKQCGSLNVARTEDRMTMFRRLAAAARANNVVCEMLSPFDVGERVPFLKHDDLQGGIWIPGDGVVNPSDLCAAYVKGAKEKGAQFFENVQISEIKVENNKVMSVITNHGAVVCDFFVNCSGMWSRDVGLKSNPPVSVPVHPCEHFYIVTKPMVEIPDMMPVIRDYDGLVYFREWSGGIMAGGFEPKAKPVFHDGIPPKFEFQLLPEDWDHFEILMNEILHRMPEIQNAEIRQFLNGPEGFTPDNKMILGLAPQIKNYFVAAGMNSNGIAASGGVGYYMSEWIVHGEPSVDMWGVDIRRFTDQHNGKHANISYPEVEFESSRNLRTSALHEILKKQGAIFGQTLGYEYPLYFENSDTERLHSFGKPSWFDAVQIEGQADVGIADISSLSKIMLKSEGNEVTEFLQYLCCADINQPVGTVMTTGMLNNRGCYENYFKLIRLDQNRYMMLSPACLMIRAMAWLRTHQPSDDYVTITDVTMNYTALNVIGPKAGSFLNTVTLSNISEMSQNSAMFTEIGDINDILVFLNPAFESDYCLVIPSESSAKAYDNMINGKLYFGEIQVRPVGHHFLKSKRIGNAVPEWGQEITSFTSPLDITCGLLESKNENFIGKDALLVKKQNESYDNLLQLFLTSHDIDNDIWPSGGEPIYSKEKIVGFTSSSVYHFDHNKSGLLCFGYVKGTGIGNEQLQDDTLEFEIDVAGKRFRCVVQKQQYFVNDHYHERKYA